MKNYIRIKHIKAEPMTLGEYNKFRGWELPKYEDHNEQGYLVEYLNYPTTGMPEGFTNYVSWSPASVFEDSYKTVGNKVEYEHIESMVDSLIFKFVNVEGTTVTGCWAFLPSGFQVGYGESACVDPANYDKELGEKYAKERCVADATNKLWELEGYLLSVIGLTSNNI